MTRCDFDGLFYRVFCVTLLAIAFTFTIILTNVFIDIDGLLANKEKYKEHDYPAVRDSINNYNQINSGKNRENKNANVNYDIQKSPSDNTYEEDTENIIHRKKRSLDSADLQYHINDAKAKNLLSLRLASILKKLEDESKNSKFYKLNSTAKATFVPKYNNSIQTGNKISKEGKMENTLNMDKENNNMMYLTMGNIFLQGVIENLNLKEIYKQMRALRDSIKKKVKRKKAGLDIKAPKVLVKTVIKTTSAHDDEIKDNYTNSKEIQSTFTLAYSGKSIEYKQHGERVDFVGIKTPLPDSAVEEHEQELAKNAEITHIGYLNNNVVSSPIPNSIMNDKIAQHFSKTAKISNRSMFNLETQRQNNNRHKRSIRVRKGTRTKKSRKKIKESNDTIKFSSNLNQDSSRVDEEELYVEIETHFDNDSGKSEKKRKLAKRIIDKIRKAVKANIKTVHDPPLATKVRQRYQNPLIDKDQTLSNNNYPIPMDSVVHRELTPIIKTPTPIEDHTDIYEKSADAWARAYFGSRFKSAAMAQSAAENKNIENMYDRNDVNGKTSPIVQRLQQPLNENNVDTSLFEYGNMKFFVKDLEGTGFSIGFNQYLSDKPNEKNTKSFADIDNNINEYHAKDISDKLDNDIQNYREIQHNLEKREIQPLPSYLSSNGYQSDEYKILFKGGSLPYDSYQQIIEDDTKKVSLSIQKEPTTKFSNVSRHMPRKVNKEAMSKKLAYLISRQIADKELIPSEIFGLADLLGRKKRSVKVPQVSKLNINRKFGKYINTKNGNKILLLNNKPNRSKRQADKIRILSADPSGQRHSEENIFVVSDENVFADRAVAKERDFPEANDKVVEEHYDYMPSMASFVYEDPRAQSYSNTFGGKFRHNALMAKYPHILMEELSKSKEDLPQENPYYFNNYYENNAPPVVMEPEMEKVHENTENTSRQAYDEASSNGLPMQDIVEAISPRTNYKLTVKISPKNYTGMNSGFKEIHTSINKSINKNGLVISSLVNVSEISRIERLLDNNTFETTTVIPVTVAPIIRHLKTEQDKMAIFLKEHKHKIDEHLNRLHKEKQRLEKYIKTEKPADRTQDKIDVWLPSNPPELLHLTREEAGQLISSALVKLRDIAPHATDTTEMPVTTYKPTTTTTTYYYLTRRPITTTTIDPSDTEKYKVIGTILHNENLTNTILTKIDKNTELLQKFLEKMTDKVGVTTKRSVEYYGHTPVLSEYLPNFKHYSPKPFFPNVMSNVHNDRNFSHLSIPFVYAYQQPYPLPNKNNLPLASVVYHGHIHTSSLQKPNIRKDEIEMKTVNKVPNPGNGTKFFIDDLENEFKQRQPMERYAPNSNSMPIPIGLNNRTLDTRNYK